MSKGNKSNHRLVYARQEDLEQVKGTVNDTSKAVEKIVTNDIPHLTIRVKASLWLSGTILAVLVGALVLQLFGVI